MVRRHSWNSIHDLFLSLYHGNRALLEQHKAGGGDMNFYGPDGYTLLIKAIIDKNSEKFYNLIDLNCDVDKFDKRGNSPLIWSIRSHQAEFVKTLIGKGANPNRKCGGESSKIPLSEAVIAKDLVMVKFLLENGADCNCTDSYMKTPLLYSFDCKSDDVTDVILNSGNVDLEKQLIASMSAGYNNLDERVFDILLQKGANPFKILRKEVAFRGLIQGELAETDVYQGTFEVKSGTMLASFIREYGYSTSFENNEFLDYLITCKLVSSFFRIDVDHDIPILKLYIENVLNVVLKLVKLGLVLPSFKRVWKCTQSCQCRRIMDKINVDDLFATKAESCFISPTPASLMLQSRTAVRLALDMSCSSKVSTLQLPEILKKYLLFEDEV